MQLVVGVAILRADRVLAARRVRPAGWEFPGGKVEPGEDPAVAAVREIHEELGCAVEITGWLDPVVEIRPGLELRVATAAMVSGEPVPSHRDHDAIRWLPLSDLDSVEWLPADLPVAARLGFQP